MDTAALQLLVDVARQGSFAAVARQQNVDPSSISRTIHGLEQELRFRLFHRSTRRLTLTEAGQVYLQHVQPLLEGLERAQLGASDVGTQPKGTLRIASPVSFAQLNVVPLLPQLAQQYPDLEFELLLSDHLPNLSEDRIDVALHLGASRPADSSAELLMPMVSRVCASPQYVERYGRPERPEDLTRHSCLVLHHPGFEDRWRFRDAQGLLTTVAVRGRLRTSNAVALKTCALGGMGIILQARWIVGQELRRGSLIDLFPDYEVSSARVEDAAVWLILPAQPYVPRKVQVFTHFLRHAFADGSPWERI